MMQTTILLVPVLAGLILISSCRNTQEIKSLQNENSQLKTENEQLKAEYELLKTENEQLKGQVEIQKGITERVKYLVHQSMPEELRRLYDSSGISQTHEIDVCINPFYLVGDYDGDSKQDFVIPVLSKQSEARRFSTEVVLRGNGEVNWLDEDIGENRPGGVWTPVFRGAQVRDRLGYNAGQPAPILNADAFILARPQSSSALIYWHGNQFALYWLSD